MSLISNPQAEGWSVVDGKLQRQFRFADFTEAFAFMVRVAFVAEKLNHHPDWSNSWNQVTVAIVDHEHGGITDRCVEFATDVNKLLPTTTDE